MPQCSPIKLEFYYIFNKESVKPFVNNYTIDIAAFWIKTSITRNAFCIEIAISFVGEGNGNVFVNYALQKKFRVESKNKTIKFGSNYDLLNCIASFFHLTHSLTLRGSPEILLNSNFCLLLENLSLEKRAHACFDTNLPIRKFHRT